ncbi:unnamed protein product [Cylicocyclus nassatus]|uniref:Uncharacterized protein n=1 Tax=Cylicocyclus nassatus TaxID=53992 RepID=A0AA36GUE0_CYLNA|nr:unnamed protein product [Cylicocyclus nassatus]
MEDRPRPPPPPSRQQGQYRRHAAERRSQPHTQSSLIDIVSGPHLPYKGSYGRLAGRKIALLARHAHAHQRRGNQQQQSR